MLPFSMKLNDEPWWKFSYQSSWDVWLVSFIPCFRGLCEERLPCYNTTGLKKWRLKILFHNGPFCPEFMNIFAQIIKILHGGRGAESSHIQLPANGRALPTICWRTWSTPRPSQRPKAPPTLLKKAKICNWFFNLVFWDAFEADIHWSYIWHEAAKGGSHHLSLSHLSNIDRNQPKKDLWTIIPSPL